MGEEGKGRGRWGGGVRRVAGGGKGCWGWEVGKVGERAGGRCGRGGGRDEGSGYSNENRSRLDWIMSMKVI